MTEIQTPPPAAEEEVLIFHTGRGQGPMETAAGILRPGASLPVPAALAAKLTAAYRHIKLAKDVIPGGAADPRVAAENKKLKDEIAKLSEQLAGGKDAAKALEDAQAEIVDLKAKLAEFLAADSKKALDALKEKHAEPAAPEPAA